MKEGTVRAVVVRDYERDPRRHESLHEIDSIIEFDDGDMMIFAQNAKGEPLPGIVLTRRQVWAIKATT